jgi:hypothetical protein
MTSVITGASAGLSSAKAGAIEFVIHNNSLLSRVAVDDVRIPYLHVGTTVIKFLALSGIDNAGVDTVQFNIPKVIHGRTAIGSNRGVP